MVQVLVKSKNWETSVATAFEGSRLYLRARLATTGDRDDVQAIFEPARHTSYLDYWEDGQFFRFAEQRINRGSILSADSWRRYGIGTCNQPRLTSCINWLPPQRIRLVYLLFEVPRTHRYYWADWLREGSPSSIQRQKCH